MAASALLSSGTPGLRGRGMAGGHDRQCVRERAAAASSARTSASLTSSPSALRAVDQEVAIAEQVECRELQLVAAQPRLDGDIGPDARGFA